MIDVKELSIGNWVNYRPGWKDEETGQIVHESGTGFPVKIEMIYFCRGEGLVQYNDGQNGGIEACDYELFPIEITPAILEKNGFIWDAKIQLHVWKYDGYYVSCDILGKTRIYVGNDYVLGQSFYVHQLQNALTLCGIDKEIELL